MQKIYLVSGALIGAIVATLLIPFISRYYSSESLAAASLLLMTHSFFGVMDVLKPIYIRSISKDRRLCNYSNLVGPSCISGVCFSVLVLLFFSFFLSDFFSVGDRLFISAAVFMFVVYSSMWAVLDAHEKVGTGALLRGGSTAVLYVLFVCKAFWGLAFSLAALFFLVHSIALFVFWFFAKKHIINSGFLTKNLTNDAVLIMGQNSGKILGDFFDRIFVSSSFAPGVVAIYNMSYDLAAKVNLPAQLFAAYWYPLLCKDPSRSSRFMLWGTSYALFILVAAALLYAFGQSLYTFYFGSHFQGYAWAFCLLLNVASMYSICFFGQALMRAAGRDLSLTLSFLIPALLGALYILIWGSVGIGLVLVGVLVMKSTSLLIVYNMRNLFEKKVLFLMCFLIFLNFLFFCVVFLEEWGLS
ncbi:MAG: hypothetical protein H2067_11200 [Alcanivorax sp.]|nr:hypothetical protein [Alcanivorax sp.]